MVVKIGRIWDLNGWWCVRVESRRGSSWNLPTPTSMCAFRRGGGVGTEGAKLLSKWGGMIDSAAHCAWKWVEGWNARGETNREALSAPTLSRGRGLVRSNAAFARLPTVQPRAFWMLSHSRRATKPQQTLAELLMHGRHVSLFFALFSCSLRRSHSHVCHRWGGRPYKKGLLLGADSASSCRCDTWFMRSQKQASLFPLSSR